MLKHQNPIKAEIINPIEAIEYRWRLYIVLIEILITDIEIYRIHLKTKTESYGQPLEQ